jgi:hypothetical protein
MPRKKFVAGNWKMYTTLTQAKELAAARKKEDAATKAIQSHLDPIIKEPRVTITITQIAGKQEIQGEFMVNPDGMINLKSYGEVYVAGHTTSTDFPKVTGAEQTVHGGGERCPRKRGEARPQPDEGLRDFLKH